MTGLLAIVVRSDLKIQESKTLWLQITHHIVPCLTDVATVGLPDPCPDHAVVMARFARDCLFRFNVLARRLVLELGPDCEELDIRIGVHSGPVTAGVLRGERARFQLFGETVNVAATVRG